MILEALTVFMLVSSALALVLMDMALSPESEHFPCGGTKLRWLLRVFALGTFNWATILFTRAFLRHDPIHVPLPITLFSMSMFATVAYICYRLLCARLPAGTWARLQRRVDAHHRAAARR